MNREVTVALVPDGEGGLHMAAAEVARLLRTLGGTWLTAVRAGVAGLDEETVALLAIELAKLADRIDVECIAHSTSSTSPKDRGR
ncbi:DUF6213 family protein [Streptomyces sp. NPDC055287]